MTGLRARILQLDAAGVPDVEIAARVRVRLQIVRKLLPREEEKGCTEDTERHGEHREAVCEGGSVPPSVDSVTPDLAMGGIVSGRRPEVRVGEPASVSVPLCLCGSPSPDPVRFVFVSVAAKPRDADADQVEAWIAEHGVTRIPRGVSAVPLARTREEMVATGWKILHHKQRMQAWKRKSGNAEERR